jgi:hypothetical protein
MNFLAFQPNISMDLWLKGTGFDPHLDHKKTLNLSDFEFHQRELIKICWSNIKPTVGHQPSNEYPDNNTQEFLDDDEGEKDDCDLTRVKHHRL